MNDPIPAKPAEPELYPAHVLLDILGEARRNIVAGTTLMNYGSFDHAALNFEIAADKLRLVQREYDDSAARARRET